MEAWVSAPGSIAGIAIVFGEFVAEFLGEASGPPQLWGIAAVAGFASINLMGVRWGGRTQVTLTTIKITGVLTLVIGSFFFAEAVAPAAAPASNVGLAALLRFVGIGVAAVFRLRKRALENGDQYLTSGYPYVPLVFIVVITLLMVNAFIYNPWDTLMGVGLTALGLPVYVWLKRTSSTS